MRDRDVFRVHLAVQVEGVVVLDHVQGELAAEPIEMRGGRGGAPLRAAEQSAVEAARLGQAAP
jgi:hypothetical protein